MTYYPDQELILECINNIIFQVKKLYIFDNTPKDYEIMKALINVLPDKNKVVLISRDYNIGVTSALNIICQTATFDGFKWILLLDQDSLVCDEIIYNYNNGIKLSKVGMICPIVIDNIDKESISTSTKKQPTEFLEVESGITSGSFINLDVYNLIGGFYEKYFVYGTDNDYSLRLNLYGFKIYISNMSFIIHEFGNSESTIFSKFFAKFSGGKNQFFVKRNYSLVSIFFQFKAAMILIRRWCCIDESSFNTFSASVGLIVNFFRFIFIESNRIGTVNSMIKGIIAGLKENIEKGNS